MSMIKRIEYLEKLKKWKDKDLIKVVTGIRRCGKSTLLELFIEYLKEAKYIDDKEYIRKTVNNFMILKNLSIREIKYKLLAKGLKKDDIEDYIYENKDELENFEMKSAQNIIYKKATSLDENEIKQFLLKKGYKSENINKAFED